MVGFMLQVDAEAESLMEELEGIGQFAEAPGSPLLASLNEEARLGGNASSHLLDRHSAASAEASPPPQNFAFYKYLPAATLSLFICLPLAVVLLPPLLLLER